MKKETKNWNKKGVIVIEGHVQGLSNTRTLGKEGIPVIVVDKDNCIARYSRYCSGFYYCPDYKSDKFADFLIELAKREQLQGWVLLPSNDHAVYTISRFKDQLSEFYKIISPDIEILNKIYKKHRLLEIAKTIDVPIPETYFPEKKEEIDSIAFRYPVMIKGREGLTFYKSTGRKVFIAKDRLELQKIIESLPESILLNDIFIQEIIPTDNNNKTISFTAFCINGEIKAEWIGVKLREHPAKFGTSTLSESIANDEMAIISRPLLKELKYTGVCEVEYLLDPRDQKYKLIEINARTWLWVGLAVYCGINYPLMIYNYLNQIDYEYPVTYKTGIRWINMITDFTFTIKRLLVNQISMRQYINSIRGELVHAVCDKQDLKPGIMFMILLPYLAVKR